MGFSTLIGYIIVMEAYADKVASAWMPTVCMAWIAFTIGGLFMSIYGMAVDTIL